MTRSRSRLLSRGLPAMAGACVLLLSAACGSSDKPADVGAASADGVVVETGLLTFSPQTVQVDKGQSVTWVGGDNIAHVLVQGPYELGSDRLRTDQTDDKTFNLELSKTGQKVSHTYTTAGTFSYFCTIHKGMNGSVVVS